MRRLSPFPQAEHRRVRSRNHHVRPGFSFSFCLFIFLETQLSRDLISLLLSILLVLKPTQLYPITTTIQTQYKKLRKLGSCDGPWGVAVGKQNQIFVSDINKCKVLVFSPTGDYIKSFGSRGKGSNQFDCPTGIAIDYDFNILVCDSTNSRLQVWKSDLTFWFSITLKPGSHGVAVSKKGRILCSSSQNNSISVFSSIGGFLFEFGVEGSGKGQLSSPQGVVMNNNDDILVCDLKNHRIQMYDSEGTFLRSITHDFACPHYLVVDAQDRIAVTQRGGGVVILGNDGRLIEEFGKAEFDEKNGKLSSPSGIAVDKEGNFIIADATWSLLFFGKVS